MEGPSVESSLLKQRTYSLDKLAGFSYQTEGYRLWGIKETKDGYNCIVYFNYKSHYLFFIIQENLKPVTQKTEST